VFTTKLQEWEDYYNFERPHGALRGETPYERLRSKMKSTGVRGHRQLHTERKTGLVRTKAPSLSLTADCHIHMLRKAA
jgi:hypothetical protein